MMKKKMPVWELDARNFDIEKVGFYIETIEKGPMGLYEEIKALRRGKENGT